MPIYRSMMLAGCLLLAVAARAEDLAATPPLVLAALAEQPEDLSQPARSRAAIIAREMDAMRPRAVVNLALSAKAADAAKTVRPEDGLQPPLALDDAVYKGVLGKALDAVPMDPKDRAVVQKTNAVVGNTLTGRSLSAWVGAAANPFLMIAGLVWGVFAASKIEPVKADGKPDTHRVEPPRPVVAGPTQVAVIAGSWPQ